MGQHPERRAGIQDKGDMENVRNYRNALPFRHVCGDKQFGEPVRHKDQGSQPDKDHGFGISCGTGPPCLQKESLVYRNYNKKSRCLSFNNGFFYFVCRMDQ